MKDVDERTGRRDDAGLDGGKISKYIKGGWLGSARFIIRHGGGKCNPFINNQHIKSFVNY